MDDYLSIGIDQYPGRENYNYDSSIYLDYAKGPLSFPRAYTEDTRNDKMKGCEPCAGFSSMYYDKCYAKEGNQCIGRPYPQCMRSDPHCPQLESPKINLYEEDPPENTITETFSNYKKEAFGGNVDIDKKTMLIIILLLVVLVLLNDKKRNKQQGGGLTPQLGMIKLQSLGGNLYRFVKV